MAPSPTVLLPIIAATVCAWAVPQRSSTPPEEASTLVRVLDEWANAFDSGELDIDGEPDRPTDRPTDRLYKDHFVDGLGVLGLGRKTTHMAVLQALCLEAESQASVDAARAVLHIASVGLNRSLFDPEMLSVRDLGYGTLMRMENEAVWVFLMDAAAGNPSSWSPGLEPVEISPAQQVAAIGLLGRKNREVFRVPLESRLMDVDPRIRLAASEALGEMRKPESLPVITRALVAERHPVVSHALVHTLDRLVLDAQKAGHVTTANVENAGCRVTPHLLCGNRADLTPLDLRTSTF